MSDLFTNSACRLNTEEKRGMDTSTECNKVINISIFLRNIQKKISRLIQINLLQNLCQIMTNLINVV